MMEVDRRCFSLRWSVVQKSLPTNKSEAVQDRQNVYQLKQFVARPEGNLTGKMNYLTTSKYVKIEFSIKVSFLMTTYRHERL